MCFCAYTWTPSLKPGPLFTWGWITGTVVRKQNSGTSMLGLMLKCHPWSSKDHQLKTKGSETEQSRAADPVRQEFAYPVPSVTSEVSWSPVSYWLLSPSSQTKTAMKFGAVLQVKSQLVDSPEALSHNYPGSLGCNSLEIEWHQPMPYLQDSLGSHTSLPSPWHLLCCISRCRSLYSQWQKAPQILAASSSCL